MGLTNQLLATVEWLESYLCAVAFEAGRAGWGFPPGENSPLPGQLMTFDFQDVNGLPEMVRASWGRERQLLDTLVDEGLTQGLLIKRWEAARAETRALSARLELAESVAMATAFDQARLLETVETEAHAIYSCDRCSKCHGNAKHLLQLKYDFDEVTR